MCWVDYSIDYYYFSAMLFLLLRCCLKYFENIMSIKKLRIIYPSFISVDFSFIFFKICKQFKRKKEKKEKETLIGVRIVDNTLNQECKKSIE